VTRSAGVAGHFSVIGFRPGFQAKRGIYDRRYTCRLRAGASTSAVALRRRAPAAPLRVVLAATVALAAVGIALGLVFAGSSAKLAEGVQIAGVDVGGLTPSQARKLLEGRSAELAHVPVTFVAGSERFQFTPSQLGVTVDWAAAAQAAQRQGEGFGPVRGFRRLRTRVFGADVAPPTRVFEAALTFAVGKMATAVERPARDAALRLKGLRPVIVPSATGHALDREAAEAVVVRALAAFSRSPVGLPVVITEPNVTPADLRPALRAARVAVSAPIRLDLGTTRWRVPRWRIAELLALPSDRSTRLGLGGPAAERYLERIADLVGRAPKDASFAPNADGTVSVVPAAPGVELDRVATAEAILAAATSRANRLARVVVLTADPELTTDEAKAMGITRLLSAFATGYAGTSDRIHNLQLAVSLLDGALVAPGATFSLNERIGERTEERGFRSAPVIIEDEYEEGIGGGVSQVATTVFNAAWEAGLKIVERVPHALYISRYPLGRDATVNYPDLDVKFLNDTEKWILVRAFSTETGITVGLYGAPTGRRVESEAGPLVVRGPAPIERISDATLEKGTMIVEEDGEPPRAVTVTRTVYLANGDVLYEESWRTSYRGEERVVRVGTKPKPEPETKPKKPATTTPTTETEPPPR
jgi:vancomycin resistance protein YoaR